MFANSHRYFGMTVLAMSLALSFPAIAQTNNNVPPPANAGGEGDHGGWGNEGFEHQEFREEMEQIRKEHEDIEAARDRLKEQCEHTGGQQAQACEGQRKELHERVERLHERRRVLHEKIEAARKEHHEHDNGGGENHGGMRPQSTPPTAPAGNQ